MANSRQRTQRSYRKKGQPLTVWKQLLLGFFVLLSVLTFSILFVLESASQPFVTVEKHAIAVARKYTTVKDVSQVTIFNGKETYFNVQGKNQSGQDIYVLVPEKSSEIFVYQATEGISQADAEHRAQENGAESVEKTVLGYQDGHTIWEVKSGRGYYLIDFITGELIKKEGL